MRSIQAPKRACSERISSSPSSGVRDLAGAERQREERAARARERRHADGRRHLQVVRSGQDAEEDDLQHRLTQERVDVQHAAVASLHQRAGHHVIAGDRRSHAVAVAAAHAAGLRAEILRVAPEQRPVRGAEGVERHERGGHEDDVVDDGRDADAALAGVLVERVVRIGGGLVALRIAVVERPGILQRRPVQARMNGTFGVSMPGGDVVIVVAADADEELLLRRAERGRAVRAVEIFRRHGVRDVVRHDRLRIARVVDVVRIDGRDLRCRRS